MIANRIMYAGDILNSQMSTAVPIGKMAVFQLTLAEMHIFNAGDNISATTHGLMPLNIFSTVGLSL